ncbi:MAG TPA: metallophosphoesterase [Terriglobales bacterium]|nr:metallophosphoesterase [Terriglobales bacterium]
MRRPLRLLHTADVHLDADARLIERVVDRALADAVDLLLIAGDLFDHNRVPETTVAATRAALARLRRPVVILPGNHDCLDADGVYARHDFAADAAVRVIRDLGGETVALPELDAVVWGRGMAEHEPGFQPLGGIPARDGARWHLAMAHGFFYAEPQRADRSSPIFADEIRVTGWDYVALGHHHLQADVTQGAVAAWYAGAPGTVLRIELDASGIRVEPRPLD